MDRVCGWLESVSAVQNSGKPAHPDDLRSGELSAIFIFNTLTHTHTHTHTHTAQRIARSLEAISLYPTKTGIDWCVCVSHSLIQCAVFWVNFSPFM